MAESTLTTMRLDKWLWVARFYKTRVLAAEAINGGHVHVNGSRAKPAKMIKVSDEIKITKGAYVFLLTVLDMMPKRGPASQAQMLYKENEESIKQREKVSAERKLVAQSQTAPSKRPDKRSRRQIIRFINKNKQE